MAASDIEKALKAGAQACITLSDTSGEMCRALDQLAAEDRNRAGLRATLATEQPD